MTTTDYDDFAAAYAVANDSGLFNAWYDRPEVLRLLGDVAGRRVLDVGCGHGPLMSALRERGASASGFDLSDELVRMARERLGDGADLRVHDLREPLPYATGSFDAAAAALVLHYLPDWSGPLRELHRVLGPGGRLVVSVNHPGAFPLVHGDLDYFALTEYTEDYEFDGRTVWLTFWHRPLSDMVAAFADAGFRVVRMTEPPPADDTPADLRPATRNPDGRFLGFLFVELESVPVP